MKREPSRHFLSERRADSLLLRNLVNGVNAFSLVLTATFCLIGPWVVNIVGFRWGLVIATYGYPRESISGLFPLSCSLTALRPVYSAGLYYHQVSDKTWLMWFGTLLCGTSGGKRPFLAFAEPSEHLKLIRLSL